MIKKLRLIAATAFIAFLFAGCEKDNGNTNPTQTPPQIYTGYAQPGGVLILNQGARTEQNSSITYIAPDGTIEENIYRNANGTAFGNEAQDLYMYNGKIYLLSNDLFSPNDEKTDDHIVACPCRSPCPRTGCQPAERA